MKWETLPCGIYFNMPFPRYLSLKCLNASGIKELNISETDFWARSFMNPDYDDIDEDTRAKIEGRAYHKRILEGKEAFYQEYCPDFEDDGDPDLLRSNDDMKEALTKAGVAGLSNKTAPLLAKLVQENLPGRNTVFSLKESIKNSAGKRELVPPKTIRHIEFTAKMIERHPDTKEYFKGGYPEVTVIFEAFGVKFKIRFDYLKVWDAVDLKTFANQFRAELSKAVRKAFANNRYHIQGSLYLIGLEVAKMYAAQGKVYDFEKVEPDANRRKLWLELFSKNPCNELKYAFVQKGVAPCAIPLVFSREEKGFAQGVEIIKNGVERFQNAFKLYGTDYWITSIREQHIYFDDLPSFVNDI